MTTTVIRYKKIRTWVAGGKRRGTVEKMEDCSQRCSRRLVLDKEL